MLLSGGLAKILRTASTPPRTSAKSLRRRKQVEVDARPLEGIVRAQFDRASALGVKLHDHDREGMALALAEKGIPELGVEPHRQEDELNVRPLNLWPGAQHHDAGGDLAGEGAFCRWPPSA